jgi:hypothetical protein
MYTIQEKVAHREVPLGRISATFTANFGPIIDKSIDQKCEKSEKLMILISIYFLQNISSCGCTFFYEHILLW